MREKQDIQGKIITFVMIVNFMSKEIQGQLIAKIVGYVLKDKIIIAPGQAIVLEKTI